MDQANSPRESRTAIAHHICRIQTLPQEHRSDEAVSSESPRNAIANNRTPRKAKTIASRPRNRSDTQLQRICNNLLSTHLSSASWPLFLPHVTRRRRGNDHCLYIHSCKFRIAPGYHKIMQSVSLYLHFLNCHGLLARSGRAHSELLQRRRDHGSTAI